MRNKYFGPVGEYIHYLLFFLSLSTLSIIVVASTDGSFTSIVGLFSSLVLFSFFMYFGIKRFSYYLIVDGNLIKERGIFSAHREIDVRTIKSIERSPFQYIPFSAVSVSSSRLFFLRTETQMIDPFPVYAVSSKLIGEVIRLQPLVSLDNELADLLPADIRREKGIDLSVIDRVSLLMGNFLLSVLFLLACIIFSLVIGEILLSKF